MAFGKDGGRVGRAVLEIENVSKIFGALTVLDRCSLSVSEGEILTLLGPSGCGKTTLLRCIAGFAAPDKGRILIDERDTVPMPVNRRPVGVVFQSYALFPHLTVAGNVGYGLRMRGTDRAGIDRRVAAALQIVSLDSLAGRYPAHLSGGQQQRVAVARVLVLEPRILLLDEPFSALDAKLRTSMQMELRELIKRLGMTAIFVTHDQEEALTLSDRIAVMRRGRIEQVDTPQEVYDHPANEYVADFVGASNILDLEARDGRVVLPDGQCVPSKREGAVRVMVRPHNIALGATPEAGGWQGTIRHSRHVGSVTEYAVASFGGGELRVVSMRIGAAAGLSEGSAVSLRVIDPAFCPIYGAGE
ncbi:ABC transporter ATP-binding protein [Aureimonas populi]|uniref:ABC transporter ATP-binding protein n=1 Tax=Aureimonas populi TaxID=1701758 RepID=A0ABW5CRK7_9HYPH|nr:ABC transporter ATP-binding protein [Aureimonas populi]